MCFASRLHQTCCDSEHVHVQALMHSMDLAPAHTQVAADLQKGKEGLTLEELREASASLLL